MRPIVFSLSAMLLICNQTIAVPSISRPSWFVGETIICVNNRFLDLSDAPELTEGKSYTIKKILPERRGNRGLVVREVGAKPKFLAFDERRFRPLFTIADRD